MIRHLYYILQSKKRMRVGYYNNDNTYSMSIPPIDYIMKQYEQSDVQPTPFVLVKEKNKNIQKRRPKKNIKKDVKRYKNESRLIPYPPCVPRNLNLKFSSEKKIVKRDSEIKTILNEMSDKMIKKNLIDEKVISNSSRAPNKLLKDVYSYIKSSNISIQKK